jgi:ArsR family transcriptional regulator
MSSPCCSSKPAPSLKHLDALTELYATLADPTRLRILALLTDGELCVCHLHDSLKVSQPTVSRHLAYLRRSGLVAARRAGTWMHYKLVTPEDPVIRTVLTAALHALSHSDVSTRDYKRLQVELAAS